MIHDIFVKWAFGQVSNATLRVALPRLRLAGTVVLGRSQTFFCVACGPHIQGKQLRDSIPYRVAPQPVLIVFTPVVCFVTDSGVFCLCHHKFRYFPVEGCSTSVLFPAFLRV